MTGKIVEICTPILQEVVSLWRRVPLRIQGIILIGLPLLAFVISASLALLGNYQRPRIETDLHRHFQMASSMSDVLTLMVNAETGMRGYLLTQRDEFLDPYAIATRNLPIAMSRVHELAKGGARYLLASRKAALAGSTAISYRPANVRPCKTATACFATRHSKNSDIRRLRRWQAANGQRRANLSVMQAEEERLLNERGQRNQYYPPAGLFRSFSCSHGRGGSASRRMASLQYRHTSPHQTSGRQCAFAATRRAIAVRIIWQDGWAWRARAGDCSRQRAVPRRERRTTKVAMKAADYGER